MHEVRRAGLNQLTVDPANSSQIIVEQVLPEDVGGWWIREIGIFDEAGDLCAVANCPPSYKPVMAEGSARTQVVRIVLIVASTAAIELKIDPSVILATRKYVDDQDITVRAYSDAQLAKHLAAVDPHPLLAKVAYVDQKDTSARSYGDQQLAKHLAAADPHPLLAKVAYVDQQDTNARTYGDQQLAKHQAAADPHPLLAKVTYVDQQDISVRAYGDQQLVKHQAAADPHSQYSKKEVATPPKFDASTKLANTDFVQRARGSLVGFLRVDSDRALTADDAGSALLLGVAATTLTIPNPQSLGIPFNSGTCVHLHCTGPYDAQLVAGVGTSLVAPDATASITLKKGQSLTLMATNDQIWRVIDSNAEMWRNADFNNYFKEIAGTPVQFNASTRIATTEFVQRVGFQYAGTENLTASRALTAADVGKVLIVNANMTLTLPAASSLPAGATLTFFVYTGAYLPTYVAAGTDSINGGKGPVASYTQKSTGFVHLTSEGATAPIWSLSGNACLDQTLAFDSAQTHQRLPGGTIFQWGQTPASAGEEVIASLPIAFPRQCLSITGSQFGTGVAPLASSFSAVGNAQYKFRPAASGSGPITSYFLAIGN
ncbi:Uncharacterised protein [Janthinobacterium lividum]|nr:Uncharacterised protein [Janthinobacterium lividum]